MTASKFWVVTNPVQSSSDDIPEYRNHPRITSAVHYASFWNCQEWFRPSVICLTKCTFLGQAHQVNLCTWICTWICKVFKYYFTSSMYVEKGNCSIPKTSCAWHYLQLGLALYLKSHWYSRILTSVRQIIQDFQEWTWNCRGSTFDQKF